MENVARPTTLGHLLWTLLRNPSESADERQLLELLAHPSEDDRTLVYVVEQLGLDVTDALLGRLALAVEEDLEMGRTVAELQRPVGGSRPVLGFAARLLQGLGLSSVAQIARSAAVEVGLIEIGNPQAPLAERPLGMSTEVVQALRGHRPSFAVEESLPPLGTATLEQARRYGTALATEEAILVIRTPHRAEGQQAAVEVARAAGANLLRVGPHTVGASVQLQIAGAWPVFHAEPGPAATTVIRRPPRFGGPMIVVASVDGAVADAEGAPTLTWRVPTPPVEDRAALWRQALGEDAAVNGLASQHRHRAGRIADLARLARVAARVAGDEIVTEGHVRQVAREGHDALGKLAQLLSEAVPDEALILAPRVRADLDAFLARARYREALVDGLGVASRTRYRTGLKALMVGPSGTGKTLAAGWIAGKLGLPLYRVDLASVVSKYIGETEQNLAELLARAEAAEVLLFFDEADSLFGKRTEVRQSTDRFANSQTNYLLQRIEAYDGLVLLASNSRTKFDPAFSRRLDLIIEFPPPPPPQRRDLWRAHLGPDALSIVELNLLATACDLPGGHVRNAVLSASVRAHEAKRPLSLPDVIEGVRMEYRKLGKTLPHALAHAPTGS